MSEWYEEEKERLTKTEARITRVERETEDLLARIQAMNKSRAALLIIPCAFINVPSR
jgi:chromosome segregation ATPase